jgi:hypothetical protein
MDAIVSKGKAKIVLGYRKAFLVQMSHLIDPFLLRNLLNFYMDILGKVLYIHNRHLPSPLLVFRCPTAVCD